MFRSALGALLLSGLLFPASAFCADNPVVRAIVAADQADRRMPNSDWRALVQRDGERRERIKAELRGGRINTEADFEAAALVFQHGQSDDDIRLAHALSTVAAALDPADMEARWLQAASWDRLLVLLRQPQWYGTQSKRNATTGRSELLPVLEGAVTDEDRRAHGVLPLAELRSKLERSGRPGTPTTPQGPGKAH